MFCFFLTLFYDIVGKYNNTHHKTINMKTIDVNSNSYPEYNVDSNDKDPKLKIGYYVRISKYKNICHYVKTFLIGQKKFSYTENKKFSSMDLCYY